MARPTSSTVTKRSTSVAPVSGSTATWATCAPYVYVSAVVVNFPTASTGALVARVSTGRSPTPSRLYTSPPRHSSAASSSPARFAASATSCDFSAAAAAAAADPPPLAGHGPAVGLRAARVVTRLERPAARCRVIAAVVRAGGLVRHERADGPRQLRRRDEVPQPDVGGIEPQVGGHEVEQALAEEIGLEPARPAIRADRRLVGDHRLHLAREVRDAVRARQKLRRLGGDHAAVRAHVRAHVGEQAATQSQDGAVRARGDLELALDLAGGRS